MATRKTYATVIVGAVVALTPPILVYLQGRAELQMKYAEANAEADAGYKTLVESVRELRTTVSAQHDAITKMQGYLDGLRAAGGTGSGSVVVARPLPPPLPAPRFHELPANLDAAQMIKR